MLITFFRGLVIVIAFWVFWRIMRSYIVRSPLDNIPGPSSSSLWRGNMPEVFGRHGWEFQDEIDKAGRPIARITGMFNKPALYVYDPKALHHIIVKDQHVFQRTPWNVAIIGLTLGRGLLGTTDELHRKQRKMLNPVFSINHMRHMTPLFYQTAHRLRKALASQLGGPNNQEIDMLKWMGRTALELIGQGGLGCSFDPLLTDMHNSFGEALKAFLPALGRCLNYRMLAHHHTKFGPASLRRKIVDLVPDPNLQELKDVVDIMDMRSKEILESKRAALRAGDEAVKKQVGEGKDIMSILLRANMSTSEDKLSEEELIAQMTSLVLAATDTTSNALSRTLELLSKYPDVQAKLRAEILQAGQSQDIPYDQLVELPYLDAICRETLRLYPPVQIASREPRHDIVLPFSEPIVGIDGTTMNEVVVPKGTTIIVAIRSCNRNKRIWGEDAWEWKPERWLGSVPSAVKEARVPGIYANLMTFLGGGHSCIGFKFSQLEMKVVLAVLITSFERSPDDEYELVCLMSAANRDDPTAMVLETREHPWDQKSWPEYFNPDSELYNLLLINKASAVRVACYALPSTEMEHWLQGSYVFAHDSSNPSRHWVHKPLGFEGMFSTLSLVFLISAISYVLWRIVRRYVVKSPLDNIGGPPSRSVWRGNMPQLFGRHGWQFQDEIDKAGRPIARITGMFNKPALYVFDPKALQHIIVKDQNVFQRAPWNVALLGLTLGRGLLGTTGETHRKQRKMLVPVFSVNHMRQLTPIFYETAHRLRKVISSQLEGGNYREIDMLEWMGRTTLELIGQGGLGYSFDPLVADTHNVFEETLKEFSPALGRCLDYRMLADHHTKFGPASLRRMIVNFVPDPNLQELKHIVDVMDLRSKEIIEGKRTALRAGDEDIKQQVEERSNIIGTLLSANISTSPEDKLSEEELIGQMTTLIFAASDTTSNALSRTLDLLTKYPHVQDRLRAEVLEAGQGQDIPYDKLVALPYLDAVCRETLRLYPPVQPQEDIILPLSEPVKGIDGTMITEVFVPKGTTIIVGMRSCNRNKRIWGEDVLEWKPERWLDSVPSAVKEAKIPGVYANLMTFLGGPNSCIGFKFSQLEMKVVLAVLISTVKFASTGKEVYWNTGSVSYPTIGRESRKACIPLKVQLLSG
ncbi:hypothetical protein NM688_g3552 [Phlebia brevispora]|uniref:Uncharacterized protein n=1 Tax=Phlebia brevispora TaxID=194682 RepID=A0ACC1T5U7_9APHY|nr:hypothetical protein NM688_g3552 [Phlebia brevispora]